MRPDDVTATRDCEGTRPSETGRGAVALLHAAGDPASFRAWSDDLRASDLLGFVDRVPYAERLRHARSTTGVDEAFVAGELRVHGLRVAAGAYEYAFIGGGMGSVVDERISRLFQRATELALPVFVVHGSPSRSPRRRRADRHSRSPRPPRR